MKLSLANHLGVYPVNSIPSKRTVHRQLDSLLESYQPSIYHNFYTSCQKASSKAWLCSLVTKILYAFIM